MYMYLTHTGTIEKSIGVRRNQCHAMLNDYMTTNGSDYPWTIGQFTIVYMCTK